MGTATSHPRSAVTLGVPLDRDHAAVVRDLAARLGSPPSDIPLCPHVSLLVLLDDPQRTSVDAALRRVAARTPPFSVRARDFGAFDDGDGGLVLHVPVVRTTALASLHRELFDAVTAAGARVDGHYTPASWFPHVTLWDRLTPSALASAVATLAARPPLAWTLPVTHLSRLEASGIATTAPLEGPSSTRREQAPP